MSRPRPSTGPSSNGGGQFLQGVWMSKCEGGRIERLTKWSDGQKDQKFGSLDKQEHDSMVRMNLLQLEVRDELAALKKSKRTPGHKPGQHEASLSPPTERTQVRSHGDGTHRKGVIQSVPLHDTRSADDRGMRRLGPSPKFQKDSSRTTRGVRVNTHTSTSETRQDKLDSSKSDTVETTKPVRKVGRVELSDEVYKTIDGTVGQHP